MTIESPKTLGPFSLVRLLGRGAMGEVHLAIDKRDGRHYALKSMRHELCHREDLLARFERETRLAMTLEHPHILPIYERGVDGTLPWAKMPWIPDGNLTELLQAQGPLPDQLAIQYMRGVLSALAHLHKNGLYHRDVKPENILRRGDHVFLTDLGLVIDDNDRRITRHAQPLGTPGHMSPEQWRGQPGDARTDVFAAGVLLYNLLTNRLPYPGKTHVELLERMLEGTPEPLNRDLDPELTKLIWRAISPAPEARFQDAAAMLDALERWAKRPNNLPDLSLDTLEHDPTTTLTTAPPAKEHRKTMENAPLSSSSSTGSNPRQQPLRETLDPRKLAIHPVEFAENSYWVGKRPPNEIFYANPYLRRFEGEGKEFNLIIDPGSSADFSIVQAKCNKILGDLSKLSAIFINHQDPDVASSVGVLVGRYAPKAFTMCTEDTWRLIQYHNITREKLIALEKYPRGFSLPTGDWLLPVGSPFCHFVGAMMLYDPQSRVLYTGDLFGSLTNKDAKGLWADESDWVGMRAFHQIYMPTRKAIQNAIANIRSIDGEVELIAPQHGRLLRGEWVQEFIERLERLPVGLDIIEDRQATPEELGAWSNVLERAINAIAPMTDKDLRGFLLEHKELEGLLKLRSSRLEITALGKFTLEHATRLIADYIQDQDLMSMYKYEVIFATNEFDLATPSMELDEDGGPLQAGSSMLGSVGV